MNRSKTTSFLALVFATTLLSGCGAGKNKTQLEFFTDMWDQPSYKSQDWDPDNRVDQGTVMVPPEHTVPIGFKPYPYSVGDIEKAGRELINPLKGQFDPEVLILGKKRFEIYCGVCHGSSGQGDGPVAAKMIGVKPPSLVNDRVKGFPDGRLFHVITKGYGNMGSYSRQIINERDRWAVVNYIRKSLQKSKE